MGRGVAGALTATLLLAGAAFASTGIAGESSSAKSKVSVLSAVEGAHWSSNVTVKASRKSVTISSNGLPSSEYWTRPAEYAVPDSGVVVPEAATSHAMKDPAVETPLSITIPDVPKYTKKTTSTSLGPIGILLSGAPLYNPYEGDGTTVALAHNFYVENSVGEKVYFVDGCFGHPTPMGAYHYHGMPTCITEKVDGTSGPSHMIGVALDGFPIYGDRDINGNVVPTSELDQCNGIDSPTPEFPQGIYHYVLTDEATAQSSLRCYHGKVSKNLTAFTSAAVYHCVLADRARYAAVVRGAREVHAYDWRSGAATVFELRGEARPR